MSSRKDLSLFSLSCVSKILKTKIAARPLPLKIGTSLDQEFAEGIEEPQVRVQLFDPKELPHLIDFKKDILAFRRNDQVQAGKYDP